jgi:hypothetical protein
MQEQNLFEYAIIRVVPRVEREEFINVGVILFCAKQKYLKSIFEIDLQKLAILAKDLEADELNNHLISMQNICIGGKNSGPIGQLDTASRFRWLTATRSTVVQCSKVHPGFCLDPETTLQKLFNEMVL